MIGHPGYKLYKWTQTHSSLWNWTWAFEVNLSTQQNLFQQATAVFFPFNVPWMMGKCLNMYFKNLSSFDYILGNQAKLVSASYPIYSIVPFFPCGSLQLSCRQAPQGDHWESRQECWQGMEQRWTAEGGSSPAHSLAFTGLDTEQRQGTQAGKYLV